MDALTITYDAIVVGSGLSGAWVAKELTEAGLQVLLLEAGPRYNGEEAFREQISHEVRIRAAARQPVQRRHPAYWSVNPALFVDDIENPYVSVNEFTWIRGRQLGGRSLLWQGTALRFSDYEFDAASQDGYGERWPIGHRDLAPFYSKVEEFLRVTGSCDHLEQLPDGCFAPPADWTGYESAFKSAVESGWPTRRVVRCRQVPMDRRALIQRGSEKEGGLNAMLDAAMSTKRLILLHDAIVSNLITSTADDVIRGVVVIDKQSQRTREVFGRVIVLCASTLETVRLMLNSRSRGAPDGVGNSSGLLGCYLTDHLAVNAQIERIDSSYPLEGEGGGVQKLLMPKFRNVTEGVSSFVRGYGIVAEFGQPRGKTPGRLSAILEVLPRRQNRAVIQADTKDAWGVSGLNINFEYRENERRMEQDATNALRAIADRAGLSLRDIKSTRPGEFVHELGGARMGSDADTSVVNSFNQCWDFRNLFVCDGSCFVTGGWQNPSLTIMALAVRCSAFIIRALRSGALA